MPLLNTAPVGDFSASAASESEYESFENVTATFQWPSPIGLYVPQLPNLCFYGLFGTDNGTTTVTITPQMSLSSGTGGGTTPVPIYLDLAGATVLPLGTPVLLNYYFPAVLIRFNITIAGAAPDCDMQLAIGAYGG
tara:strand:+ start:508 stop:915 length:408 start_codon:yes stop_codon:yes gene_type:complete